jgi:hypothetical protein
MSEDHSTSAETTISLDYLSQEAMKSYVRQLEGRVEELVADRNRLLETLAYPTRTLDHQPRYEHKVLGYLSDPEMRSKLDELGSQGWKLVSHAIDPTEGYERHFLVMGRKIQSGLIGDWGLQPRGGDG